MVRVTSTPVYVVGVYVGESSEQLSIAEAERLESALRKVIRLLKRQIEDDGIAT